MRKKAALILLFNIFYLVQGYSFTRSHFENPSYFIIDRETGAYYVSNVNAGLPEKGRGYVSKISATGNVVIQKFIGGRENGPLLNSPKGLLILGKEIWVADVDRVKVFNKVTSKLVREIDCSGFGARYLNQLTADYEQKVYISDPLGDQILKIDPVNNYQISVFRNGKELGNPYGLVFNPKSRCLMMASFQTGQILEIDRRGKVHALKRGLSSLNGIDYDNQGNLYVSSAEKGEVYKIPYYGRGPLTIFMSGLTTPSAISCDRVKNELLISSLKGNTVTTVFLNEKIKTTAL